MTKRQGFLLDVDYRNRAGRSVPKLHFVDDDGEYFAVDDWGFSPYFLARLHEGVETEMFERRVRALADGSKATVRDVREFAMKLHGEEVRVVGVRVARTADVPVLRDDVRDLGMTREVYEAGIKFANRYIVNNGLTPTCKYEVSVDDKDRLTGIAPVEDEGLWEPHILAFDIEAHNAEGFPSPQQDPVIIVSTAHRNEDGDVETELFHGEDEKQLIEDFISYVERIDPDVITHHNGDNFDWPYLRDRCRELGVELSLGRDDSSVYVSERTRRYSGSTNMTRVTGRVNADTWKMAKRDIVQVSQSEEFTVDDERVEMEIKGDYKLESVAEFLGVDTPRQDVAGDEIAAWWDAGGDKRNRLLQYARDDAETSLRICEQLLPQQVSLSRMIRMRLKDTVHEDRGAMAENFYIVQAHEDNEIVPNKNWKGFPNRGENDFDGATVFEPKPGFHENVIYLDAVSMYPSIVAKHNIGPDTVASEHEWVKTGVDDDGNDVYDVEVEPYDGDKETYKAPFVDHEFLKQPDSFIASTIGEFIDFKNDLKSDIAEATGSEESTLKERYNSVKRVLNSAGFGYLGWEKARWAHIACSESITAWGRHYIEEASRIAEDMGWVTVTGDTDGAGFKPSSSDSPPIRDVVNEINNELPLEFEADDEFDLMLLLDRKKRYCAIEDGTIIVKGLEVRRGDWSDYAQSCQAEIIVTLLHSRDVDAAQERAKENTERFRDGEVDEEDLVISKGMSKEPSEYDASMSQVGAAKRARDYFDNAGIEPGDTIDYYVCRAEDVPGGDEDKVTTRTLTVEHANDVGARIDPDYYIHKQALPAMMRLLGTVGVSRDAVLGRPEQVTLAESLGISDD